MTAAKAPVLTTEAPLGRTGWEDEDEGATEIPEEEAEETVAATVLETTSGLVVTEAAEVVSTGVVSTGVGTAGVVSTGVGTSGVVSAGVVSAGVVSVQLQSSKVRVVASLTV